MRKPDAPRPRGAKKPIVRADAGDVAGAESAATPSAAAAGRAGGVAIHGPGGAGRPLSALADQRNRVVSTGLTDRLDERRRARRRLHRGWLIRAGAVAAVAVLVVWACLFSPLLALRTADITVTGGDGAVDAAAVQESLAAHAGRSLLRLDVDALGEQVADSLVRVREAEVTRSWPHGLAVTLTMRVPVAVRSTDAGHQVLDDEAVVLDTVSQAPEGLAVIQAEPGQELSQAQVSAVTEAIGSLSAQVRARVATGAVSGTGRVTLTMVGGATVVWGEATDNELKARVLEVLLGQEAQTYDVSSPHSPTTS